MKNNIKKKIINNNLLKQKIWKLIIINLIQKLMIFISKINLNQRKNLKNNSLLKRKNKK